MNKNENLNKLETKIKIAAENAINIIENSFTNLIDSISNGEKVKIPKNIKEARIDDLIDLLTFYYKCVNIENLIAKSKADLLHINLDTIIIEDYMDRNLLKLLDKYNEIVYP